MCNRDHRSRSLENQPPAPMFSQAHLTSKVSQTTHAFGAGTAPGTISSFTQFPLSVQVPLFMPVYFSFLDVFVQLIQVVPLVSGTNLF